jgi:hypothetical protein
MSTAPQVADFTVRDSRQPGHFWADNEILDVYGPKLGPHGLAVYMAMCRRANNTTGECMLSTRRIAEQVWMSNGGVFNALALIVALGLARIVLKAEHGKPAVYVLADVKALTCSSHEHRCSSGERGVHPVNAQYGSKDFDKTCIKTKPKPPYPPLEKGGAASTKRRRLSKAEQRLEQNLAAGERVKALFREKVIPRGQCAVHPDSGRTPKGNCWDCYAEMYPSQCNPAQGGDNNAQDDGSGRIPTAVHASR